VSSALAPPPEHAPVAQVSQPRLTNNALFHGTCGVLLFGPLTFGAVEPWSVFVLETCSLLLFLLWAYRQWINQQIDVNDQPLYRPMAAFLGLAVLQLALGTTAYRQVTYSHFLLYAAYGMLVFVATQTLRRSSQFEPMATLFAAYGAVVASFAVFEGLAPNGKLYWIWPVEHGATIYGPYVNRNHYAGLMEMLMPFPLVLAATRFTEGNRKVVMAGIAALMAASIFLSGSRGGMVAFAAQMVVLGVLLLRKREAGWKQPLMLGGFLAVVIVFLIWMGGNEVTRRLLSIHSEVREEMTGGTRITIDRDGLRMLLRKPLLGWGLGTFPVVYPEFRSFYTTFFVNQAHNDYLQLLVETGFAGFAIATWFLVLVFRGAARKLKDLTKSDGTETANGALTVAALLGCVGILVHSWLDFNLQIPANAALFYVLCAIAASAPLQESQRRRVLRRRHNLMVQPNPESTPS
jgi:O-antigen ligase